MELSGKDGSIMKEVNNLILQLATLQAAILVNANAYDDDLPETWEALVQEYDNLKTAMDKYIKME
jgi:hypothetical protein